MIYSILILGLFLRLWNLNQSFWLDEAINVMAVRDNPLSTLITSYALGDFHPPGYHIILWIWTQVFGYTEISTRMLSVLFAIGTIYLGYLAFKKFFGKSVALLSALFLSTSPLFIYYSQEARMYVETSFFALLSIYFFIKIIKDGSESGWKTWAGYIASTLILIYSEYVPFFLILAQNIIIVLERKKLTIGLIKKWIISQFILFLIFIPWLPYLLQQLEKALSIGQAYPLWNLVVGQGSAKGAAVLFIKFIIGRISIGDKFLYGIIMAPILLIVSGLFIYLVRKKWEDRIVRLPVLLFILPIIISLAVSFYFSVFSYFRFIFLLPLFYLLIILGINLLPVQSIRSIFYISFLIINLSSLLIFNTNKKFWREDWRTAVDFIESQKNSQSIAVMVNPSQNAPFKYYSQDVVPLVYDYPSSGILYNKVWLFRYVQEIFDPEDTVRKKIEEKGYKKIGEYDFSGVIVWEYSI